MYCHLQLWEPPYEEGTIIKVMYNNMIELRLERFSNLVTEPGSLRLQICILSFLIFFSVKYILKIVYVTYINGLMNYNIYFIYK